MINDKRITRYEDAIYDGIGSVDPDEREDVTRAVLAVADAELDDLRRERDRARALAQHLEEDNARLTATLDQVRALPHFMVTRQFARGVTQSEPVVHLHDIERALNGPAS